MSATFPVKLTCVKCGVEFDGTLRRASDGLEMVTVEVNRNGECFRMVKEATAKWLCFECHERYRIECQKQKSAHDIIVKGPPPTIAPPVDIEPIEVLYFGKLGSAGGSGHHLYSPNRVGVQLCEQPWNITEWHIDCGLLERLGIKDNPEAGIVAVAKTVVTKLMYPPIHVPWTAISFWDRSGDSRPGSNSAFIVQAEMLPRELLSLARLQWPEIFERPNFPVLKKLRMEVDLDKITT